MPKVTVRALKSFHYAGRDRRRGDDVPMTPIDAAVHARKGNVTLARQYRTSAMKPEPSPVPEPLPPPVETAHEASEPTRRTRRYRRRDMTAEDPHAG